MTRPSKNKSAALKVIEGKKYILMGEYSQNEGCIVSEGLSPVEIGAYIIRLFEDYPKIREMILLHEGSSDFHKMLSEIKKRHDAGECECPEHEVKH